MLSTRKRRELVSSLYLVKNMSLITYSNVIIPNNTSGIVESIADAINAAIPKIPIAVIKIITFAFVDI